MKIYWSVFLGTAERIRLWQQPGVDYNIINCEDFVFRQAGGAIYTLLELYGTELFLQKLKDQRGVLSPKYQRLLAEYAGRCYNGSRGEDAASTDSTQQNKLRFC